MPTERELVEEFVRAMEANATDHSERAGEQFGDALRQLEATLDKSPAEVAKLIDDASARMFFDGASQRVTADRLRYIMNL